ncbi:undecaprenyl-phosphate glucose phosphotransferase [Methylobacterium radiodurans]|uniref:Undecaprenyl-phosphate glucose phosphotransferase n=1 Tax=Methylobacterium radiodurans TaxID=2202828 RepID=A0A2U8VPB6_9HYPH|nr:undecaprenyl-phosphate glucose phosphotransferase [Methylobacterium radiodurans]AWN35447.1 undecaprenyl-phosphate glucose phosphotransferase [Methylobacterium radiodurans]
MALSLEDVQHPVVRLDPSSRRQPAVHIPAQVLGVGAALADWVAIALSACLAGLAYRGLTAVPAVGGRDVYLATGAVFASLYVLRMHGRGHYAVERLTIRPVPVSEMVSAWIMVIGICAGLAFILKIGEDVSRGFFLIFAGSGLAVVVGLRVGAQWLCRRAAGSRMIADRPVLLLGERAEVGSHGLHRRLRESGYRVIDALPCEFRSKAEVSACAAEAIRRSRSEPVEEILICVNWSRVDDLENLLQCLRVLPLPALVLADHKVRNLLAKPVTRVGSVLALEVQRSPLSLGEQAAKRTLDVLLAAVALVLLSPLLVLVAAAVRLESPGPALFRQTRIGFSGRRFQIYKFRSMRVQDDGPVIRQATRDDRRVTRIGRLLRRTSIDELPQLLNVLRGDMSLVGPRPHALAHDDQYTRVIAPYAYRHHVKPGITGLAQVNKCRGETETVDKMARRVSYDIQYINRWSIWLDLRIILLTAVQVFKHDAY